MISKEVLKVGSGEVALTVARGDGTGAALVMMPSAFGVAPDVEAQLQDFAARARLAVAFDPFSREDPGVVPYGEMARIRERLGQLDRERTSGDLRAVVDWARRETERVVVLGVCFGGPFAVKAAAELGAHGLVVWHPSRLENHLAPVARLRCPARLHLGSEDPLTPPEVVSKLEAAFSATPDARITIHKGATHGFTHRSAPVYDAGAEGAAVASVLELVAA